MSGSSSTNDEVHDIDNSKDHMKKSSSTNDEVHDIDNSKDHMRF